jgi:glyoxylase-like metal-dependent hydrolase (beta-lactamase superfamily II)
VVVSDSFPFMGQADSGRWMQALETIKGMDIERIVPGHGEVCGMEAVDKLVEYFKELRQQVQQLVEAGVNREEVSQQVDLLGYFPVDDDSREMAVMCVASGAELMYDEITASS